MTRSEIVTWLVLLGLYQAYATVLVAKSDFYTDSQKVRQVIFIWLVPLLGAIVARMFLNSWERKKRELDLAEAQAAAKAKDETHGG